jgi:hypothetical protein
VRSISDPAQVELPLGSSHLRNRLEPNGPPLVSFARDLPTSSKHSSSDHIDELDELRETASDANADLVIRPLGPSSHPVVASGTIEKLVQYAYSSVGIRDTDFLVRISSLAQLVHRTNARSAIFC